MPDARTILVFGGARSGKSRYAKDLVSASRRRPVMIVTAEAGDTEMIARIDQHRAARPDWRVVEAPLALSDAILTESRTDTVLLVDCLTLWLNNLFMASCDLEAETRSLLAALATAPGPVVLVSNEVGGGIVPRTALGRSFRDEQGRLNQVVAEHCDHVVMVQAGLPLLLKPRPAPTISV